MLALQTYLITARAMGTPTPEILRALSEKYSLAIKRHPSYPNLVMFKYDQIHSPMGEPLVQECRGIILDESTPEWNVVCHSFNKFFNHEEGHAAEIDWKDCAVYEKLDGSLIQMYHYDGAWHVASSGTPDAGGQVFSFKKTFAELFWEVFTAMGLSLPEVGWERFTFSWELMTPLNRVVVAHHDSKVALLAVRDNVRGIECGPHAAPAAWPKVKAFPLTTIAEIEASFREIDPMNQEGYVVCDSKYNRVKMKHPQYVVLHHMRGNGVPTAKRALECMLAGEHTEFLSYWPEWKDLFRRVEARLGVLEAELENAYQRLKDIPVQKDFALAAQKTRCASALFTTRAGKAPSTSAALRAMAPDKLSELLRLSEVDPPGVTVALDM